MNNARVIYIDNMSAAKDEMRKIGVDPVGMNYLVPKAVYITMKIENVSPYAANIIKQEMLSKGGDVAVNKGVCNFTVDKSDILIMGNYNQFKKLVYKLCIQPPTLQEIAFEIESALKYMEEESPQYFECGKYKLEVGEKTFICGILNMTPDSFSDGGSYNSVDSAIKRAKDMVEQGADIIDVGGESTRPGFVPVDAITEINRVVPLIEKLSREINVPISIDTTKALVAKKACEAGASIVNDIWALQKDPDMAEVVSKSGAGLILMHNQDDKSYTDVIGDIIKFLRKSIEIAENAGIRKECLVIDPGIGFGKTLEHNLEIMRRLKEFKLLNVPLLLGTSRKSMIGNILDLPVGERLEGTAATVTLGIANGADIVRVHDVKEMARVARMTDAMIRA